MRLRREVVVRIILRSREKNPLILSLLAECKCLHRRHSPIKRPPSHIHRWPGATTTIIVNDSRECFDKTWAFRKQQERTGEKTLLFSAAWSLCCVRGWVSVIYCAVMKDAVWRRVDPTPLRHVTPTCLFLLTFTKLERKTLLLDGVFPHLGGSLGSVRGGI